MLLGLTRAAETPSAATSFAAPTRPPARPQGMTLSRAEVEVEDAFDYGQVYVALSRCVSLAGLWTSGRDIGNGAVKAHPTVSAFYGKSSE